MHRGILCRVIPCQKIPIHSAGLATVHRMVYNEKKQEQEEGYGFFR